MWTHHNQYTVDKKFPAQAAKIINLFAGSFTLKRSGLMG